MLAVPQVQLSGEITILTTLKKAKYLKEASSIVPLTDGKLAARL
jgi:hypothetical protein